VYPAIALDRNGAPHISYLDDNDHYVKYAVKNGSRWTIQSVGLAAKSSGTIANGGLSSIAVDRSNNAHISYYDYGTGTFKYAKKSGASWGITSLALPNDPLITTYASPSIPWAESSIGVDTLSNVTHIAIQMLGGRSGCVLGYWRTGMTSAIIVDASDDAGYHNNLKLDASGNPCISYEARGAGRLKFARWNGSSFTIESLDTIPGIYWEDHLTSLALDRSGAPRIAYVGVAYGYKYASKSGGSWTVSSYAKNSGYPSISLALDGSDNPHVVLVDSKLRYGTLSGTTWTFTDMESDVNRCAIAAGKSGKIHIAYDYGNVGSIIKYASN